MPSQQTAPDRLRRLLAEPGILVMPCCFDGLSAKLIADAGYKLTFMSGFSVSAARLGLPDTGLISFGEMVDSLRNCVAAAGNLPVIGDGDTGYGNALNVQRTVRQYARAGAGAVMIEDQVSPKKCGHTKGKAVISREEARMKIRAAVEARTNHDILILARTDARGPHGLQNAGDSPVALRRHLLEMTPLGHLVAAVDHAVAQFLGQFGGRKPRPWQFQGGPELIEVGGHAAFAAGDMKGHALALNGKPGGRTIHQGDVDILGCCLAIGHHV